MGLDFRNANSLWAAVLLETWYRLGLRLAIISPGSRSTPLTVASAQHPGVEAIAILDSARLPSLPSATPNAPGNQFCSSAPRARRQPTFTQP